ncbi:hypothetical protein RF679_06070 [Undibacterium cyanobacteriorum]|uniref:Uncharacterized protein n=1 Tax=Undibacterium cyanobacteriorum TaxID=3073561 RepID=A0ABY9RKU5_9BURK|nr:hypothetical protein [Undibacterium sp. 20NA77.5]WMW81847.1 hypothetical protein RF679_06070 [Undibacterium sp. 20NA77.5]
MGYQFLANSNNEYDANWLIIEAAVCAEGRAWSFRDPSLLTWEVSALIDFFEGLASETPHRQGILFTEPNLEFIVQSPTCVRVQFSLEASPPWLGNTDELENPFAIDFDISTQQCSDAATSLRQQLARFPQRTVRSGFRAWIGR